MLRTANIISVPTPFARVAGNTRSRATWCIMWKAIIAVSHCGSRAARYSMSWFGSFGAVSVMPRWRNFPFAFSFSNTGTITSRACSYVAGGTAWSWNTSTYSRPSRRKELSRLCTTHSGVNCFSPFCAETLVHTTT